MPMKSRVGVRIFSRDMMRKAVLGSRKLSLWDSTYVP